MLLYGINPTTAFPTSNMRFSKQLLFPLVFIPESEILITIHYQDSVLIITNYY